MGVKPAHCSNLSISLPNLTPSSIHCFKPWIDSRISIKKHFESLSELWRIHILLILKPYLQSSNKNHSSHVIKGALTLNTILRHHGVSLNLIAAANNNAINDLNQLIKKSGLSSVDQEEPQGTVAIFNRNSERKPLIMLTSHGLAHAKSTGHFLALVPLIVFCIVCIVGAFRSRVSKCNGFEELDESTRLQHRPKSIRWRNALSDDNVKPDILHSKSILDYNSGSEDHDDNLSENTADAYSKVKDDYKKFLSECGISECGNWRGGVPQ